MTASPTAVPGIESEWYREIVESTPDATVMIDSEGVIVLVNRQTEALFGYSRAELLGRRVEMLVPERYRNRHHVHRDGYFGGPKTRAMSAGVEVWGLRKDGVEFPAEISLSPLRTQRGVFATAAIRDATGRRKAETQFKNLLETAPDAMVIINRAGNIVLVNAQAERMFGYTREALIGRPVEVLVPERLRDRHTGHRGGYVANPKVREMGAGLELQGRRKDGTEFPIEISLSPLETEDGVYATAAVRDITDRKLAQRRLTEYARNLEASNRELEQFAYVASHDLQAPLRNIMSFSELLREECVGKVSADADTYFGFIEESAQRLQALIKDILEVSRVNRMERSFVRMDAVRCLDQACQQIRVAIEESGAHIEYGSLPVLLGDPMRLIQLFQNLLSNAIKFQRRGTQPKIAITAERDGAFWLFRVSDNGIGIAEEECGQIFEIFRRLHTSDEYPGTGIGLSICKKIVEAHGGRIWVESRPGEGTTFLLTLPDETSVSPQEQAP